MSLAARAAIALPAVHPLLSTAQIVVVTITGGRYGAGIGYVDVGGGGLGVDRVPIHGKLRLRDPGVHRAEADRPLRPPGRTNYFGRGPSCMLFRSLNVRGRFCLGFGDHPLALPSHWR